ncbi:hypothetical protein ALC56_11486 [Trachymyrmex septentrionalis]|uniref:Uncharacterized protein n=1 Tax=Trachymyrmex septentrionalis TaxID=34720 RepID=A0A195F2R1_9HYME|nr:hypothetical protein ALC56_11486 [Trachymyrmex septentrionalis]
MIEFVEVPVSPCGDAWALYVPLLSLHNSIINRNVPTDRHCFLLSSTMTENEQTSTVMMTREREKATHGIGVVRQGGLVARASKRAVG